MKVCFIAGHYANSNNGIARYSSKLFEHIQKLDSTINMQVIGPQKKQTASSAYSVKKQNLLIPESLKKIIDPFIEEINYYSRFRENIYPNPEINHVTADIYHAVSPSECIAAVKSNKRPLITTIHDLIPLVSDTRYVFEKYCFKYYCNYAIKSDLIIVDSNNTRKDLYNIFGVPETKIKVVYPGIDTNTFHPTPHKQTRIKNIVYLGGLVKRKGIYETIYAFNKLLDVRKDVQLSIGGIGNEINNLKQLVHTLHIEQYVRFLGFINENRLAEYYQSADIFVYPSKYEGFGFTPLEAMACGVPVITSNQSSIPEVVADGAITVDPTNINEIYQQIKKVLEDHNLQKTLKIKAVQQANKFNWEKCAQETLDIYQSYVK